MASLHRDKNYQYQTDAGAPLNAGKVYFYTSAGGVGTSTPKDTYPTEADAVAGTNANPNPITLASDGRPDNSGTPIQIWIAGEYRVRVETSGGTLVSDDAGIKDVVSATDFQASTPSYGGNNTGTADALVFAFAPALTAYTNGQVLRGRITADSTGAVTINANGVGVKSLVKRDGRALRAGDLQGPAIIEFAFDSSTDVFRLTSGEVGPNIRTDVAPSTGVVTLTGYTNVRITGTSAVTGFTIPDGEACDCVAAAALPITAGASLIFPGISSGTTITLAAGDTFRVRGEASSVARVVSFTRVSCGADGLLSTTSASGASQVDFVLPPGFYRYDVVYSTTVNTDGAELYYRVSTDGGSSFLAADYKWNSAETDSGGTESIVGSASDSQIIIALNVGSAANEGSDGIVRIFDPASAARYKAVMFDTVTNDNTAGFLNKRRAGSGAYVGAATAINAVRIIPSGGTVTGTFKLYGYA